MTELSDQYHSLFEKTLKPLAINMEAHLKEMLYGTSHIDRISARAKSPDRFIAKANKLTDEGKKKYHDPLNEIQDQIGARIIVFYLQDVHDVEIIIRKYMTSIEIKSLVPETEWEFGYFGRHLILSIPKDVSDDVERKDGCPMFFELQIKTLFQHAWSEADHDLGYKSDNPLSEDQNRRLAFASAQAWGADRIFKELYSELNPQ